MAFVRETVQFAVGQRVTTKVDVERFDDGIVPAGSSGTVSEIYETDTDTSGGEQVGIITDILYVKMDDEFDWLCGGDLQFGQCIGIRPEDELE